MDLSISFDSERPAYFECLCRYGDQTLNTVFWCTIMLENFVTYFFGMVNEDGRRLRKYPDFCYESLLCFDGEYYWWTLEYRSRLVLLAKY